MPLTPAQDLPTVLHTDRLTLRLADPDDEEDCQKIIALYTDPNASIGGNARVGVNTPEDVRAKHRKQGARQELCTKAVAPKGIVHLVFLRDDGGRGEGEGEFMGMVAMNFRKELPFPE